MLLDEHMLSRRLLNQLNHHFDVKHVRDDLRHGELGDPDVYQLAATQGRIVVTFNGRDFRSLVGTIPNDPGVIDVPMGWSEVQIDTKLMALLMRHGSKVLRCSLPHACD